MYRIYKYAVPLIGGFTLELPKYANILHIAEVNGTIYLWARVDPEAPMVQREFRIFATGQDLPNDNNILYLKTIIMHGGALVWHLFEAM